MRKYKEKIMGGVFFAAALTSILAVLLICVFLFANGIPAMKKIGFADFLLGNSLRVLTGLRQIVLRHSESSR